MNRTEGNLVGVFSVTDQYEQEKQDEMEKERKSLFG